MPNGKPGEDPYTDLTVHHIRGNFPPDIEEMLLRIDALGDRIGRYPVGENWPFSWQQSNDWAKGEDLDNARRLLTHLLSMLEAGRGDEILHHPGTGKPLNQPGDKTAVVLIHPRLIDSHDWKPEGRMFLVDPRAPEREPPILTIPCDDRCSSREDAIEKTWSVAKDGLLRAEGVFPEQIKKLVWNEDTNNFDHHS